MSRLQEIQYLYSALVDKDYAERKSDVNWVALATELKTNCFNDMGFLLSHIDTLNILIKTLRDENEHYRKIYGAINKLTTGEPIL